MSQRNERKIRKQVEILRSDWEWLISHHHGATPSWFYNLFLHCYRTVCENPSEFIKEGPITPTAIALAAGKMLKEQFDEGLHSNEQGEESGEAA